MTATTARRSMLRLIFTDITDLIASQPPQALMSTASIAIVAGEAGHFVDWPANIALAVGAEWAYLRGIASSHKGASAWVSRLNWGALFLVVLYGLLWGARKFGAIPDVPSTAAAWLLTTIHIFPIAWISFCAAKVHALAVERERTEAERKQAEAEAEERERRQRDEERKTREAEEAARFAREQAAEDAKLRRWQEAQVFKASVRANTPPPVQTASGTGDEQLIEQIARTLREQPKTNKAELARTLGIGRTKLYALISEAQGRGLLDD
jgi:hypothetical protein